MGPARVFRADIVAPLPFKGGPLVLVPLETREPGQESRTSPARDKPGPSAKVPHTRMQRFFDAFLVVMAMMMRRMMMIEALITMIMMMLADGGDRDKSI